MARGKRTQFTSVSLDVSRIRDFGDTNYKLERERTVSDGHSLVEHEALLSELRRSVREAQREDSDRAARALVYATRRKEGLVNWAFNTSNVGRKDLIAWALARVQEYFIAGRLMEELFSCRNCVHNSGQSLMVGRGPGFCLQHESVILSPERTTCKNYSPKRSASFCRR